ncbi:MAG: hypothetical protein ACRCYX_03910, partial [Dermatophilaceae bacterium]
MTGRARRGLPGLLRVVVILAVVVIAVSLTRRLGGDVEPRDAAGAAPITPAGASAESTGPPSTSSVASSPT